MDDRFNTFAGWALFAGIVAFGASSVSSHYFQADKAHRPEKMGYEIEGVVSSEGGADAEEPIEALLAKADPAKGEAVFKKCTSCHTANAGGANGIGPNLHGVVGETIGTGHGFAFSDALKGHGGTWDWKNLNDWLHNPKKFAPGTKMTFAGLSKGEDRANLIAWLNTQGPNLPLPTAPAGDAAPAAAAAAPAEGAAAAGAVAAPAPGTDDAPAQDKSTVPAGH
ncbi:cytochrome c family protein [Novosphingobium sp. PS1R-30]|uniref:Cytochrome c family protein n=1 Tax=Novosphingobium anseongense TaxID=3133436 RepID=A0ABU8RWE4_9SPHN